MNGGATNDRRTARLNAALGAALICVYAAAIVFTVTRGKAVDFAAYYLAAYGFAQGEDMYARRGEGPPTDAPAWNRLAREVGITDYAPPYRYPPLTAALVWPLTYLPPRVATVLWLATSAVALIASAWLLGRTSTLRCGVPLAFALLLGFVPAVVTLYAGQVNALVLLCLCWALYAAARGHLGRAGASVAAGAMLKLVPLAHLAYFGWRGHWRAVGVGIAVIVACLVIPLPLVGWHSLLSYAHNFAALSEAGHLSTTPGNQALSGLFARLFVADAPRLAWWLTQVLSVALVAATAVLCWPLGTSTRTLKLEFALITAAVTLVPPNLWYHQMVLLLLPLFVLVDFALSQASERWMLLPLGFGYAAIAIFGVAWRSLPSPILASLPVYATIMMWTLLARLLLNSKHQTPPSQTFG